MARFASPNCINAFLLSLLLLLLLPVYSYNNSYSYPLPPPSTPALPTQPLLPVVGGARKDCRVCPSIIQLAMVVVVRTSEAGKRERGREGKEGERYREREQEGTQAGNVTMSRECCCGFCFIEL